MSAICVFRTFEDVANRCKADVADHGLGRLNWAESAPTTVASGRAGVRAKAVFPLRARNRLPAQIGHRERVMGYKIQFRHRLTGSPLFDILISFNLAPISLWGCNSIN
jgi:hypothetical protein